MTDAGNFPAGLAGLLARPLTVPYTSCYFEMLQAIILLRGSTVGDNEMKSLSVRRPQMRPTTMNT